MDRYLITGFSGFVSKHFLEYFEGLQNQASVLGIDIVLTIGWTPEIPLRQSLEDVINFWTHL